MQILPFDPGYLRLNGEQRTNTNETLQKGRALVVIRSAFVGSNPTRPTFFYGASVSSCRTSGVPLFSGADMNIFGWLGLLFLALRLLEQGDYPYWLIVPLLMAGMFKLEL